MLNLCQEVILSSMTDTIHRITERIARQQSVIRFLFVLAFLAFLVEVLFVERDVIHLLLFRPILLVTLICTFTLVEDTVFARAKNS